MNQIPQTSVAMDMEPLNTTPGSAEDRVEVCSNEGDAVSCCDDRYHRKLAVCSIICGISCIGIKALIHSVKAEKTADPEKAAMFLRQARKLSIWSIAVWLCCLASIPVLLALVSYLATLKN